MARQLFTNDAFSTLAGNVLIGATSLAVQAGDGALFPSVSGTDWFIVTLQNASNNKEIVKVTSRSTDTFTIVRAQEGTAALAWISGDRVSLRATANALALLAPLASPALTGVPTAPTATAGPPDHTDDTTVATTAFVTAAIAAIPGPTPAFTVDYIKVSETQINATSGGTAGTGTWNTRTINTEDSDSGNHCTIGLNQITLDAGTYVASVRVPAIRCDAMVARLQNITDAATTLLGTPQFSNQIGYYGSVWSNIVGKFTIAGAKAFEVQQIIAAAPAAHVLGYPAALGVDEVYTVAEFWKVA